ncbi:MAG: mannose-1-phosphate guanylyltransferase/mannose-6-phosphate isomerase [Robiginitomaculum sp.]|nr:MAG: mannose-1-phosphate guanylyltransferase/mannose-6-phosphate isomerase [Robiginitomaculum sp.]
MTTVYPVIMCGGAGTRLWPISKRAKAKQYHSLTSEYTMLQETIQRMNQATDLDVAAPSFVCAQSDENFIIEQSKAVGVDPLHIILEPIGRNTAPVAAIISLLLKDIQPTDLILLLPADHHISKPKEFWACVQKGINAANDGQLVTLGIKPTTPETGYGYIHQGNQIEAHVFNVNSFVEKPNLETAKQYLASGKYFWNAGIFLFAPTTMLDNFKEHAPDILRACQQTLASSPHDGIILALDETIFTTCPSESIDYAIMEKSSTVALVAPVDAGWNDIGSWPALAELQLQLGSDSPQKGDVLEVDCVDSYLHSDGILIAGVGLKDMIVVATKDAVLVMPKDQAQNVKKIVEQLKKTGRTDLY